MTADSKLYAGGDGKISALFNHCEQNSQLEICTENINELIAGCSESKEKLEKLYNMFKDSIFAVAFGITSDYHLAEDCVTETFVRLTQVKHFSAKKGDGKGFILTIARNVALVILKCCSELTFKEIAKIMKSPESTVKSRYKKAIAILQEKAGADD